MLTVSVTTGNTPVSIKLYSRVKMKQETLTFLLFSCLPNILTIVPACGKQNGKLLTKSQRRNAGAHQQLPRQSICCLSTAIRDPLLYLSIPSRNYRLEEFDCKVTRPTVSVIRTL